MTAANVIAGLEKVVPPISPPLFHKSRNMGWQDGKAGKRTCHTSLAIRVQPQEATVQEENQPVKLKLPSDLHTGAMVHGKHNL